MRMMIATVLLVWLQGCITINTAPKSEVSPGTSTSPLESFEEKVVISLDEFNQVKNGMSYRSVIDIFDREGTVIEERTNTGYVVVQYLNPDGGHVLITFDRLAVIKKEQVGLK